MVPTKRGRARSGRVHSASHPLQASGTNVPTTLLHWAFPDRERQSICKDLIDTILSAKLHLQELWIERAEAFILRARKRIKNQQNSSYRAITEFFLPSSRPPGPALDNLAKSTWLPPFFLPHALHLTSTESYYG